jgi:hypothetical protein
LRERIRRADSLRRAKPRPLASKQADINIWLLGCLPMALALPIMNNDDFGTSPLFCRPDQ